MACGKVNSGFHPYFSAFFFFLRKWDTWDCPICRHPAPVPCEQEEFWTPGEVQSLLVQGHVVPNTKLFGKNSSWTEGRNPRRVGFDWLAQVQEVISLFNDVQACSNQEAGNMRGGGRHAWPGDVRKQEAAWMPWVNGKKMEIFAQWVNAWEHVEGYGRVDIKIPAECCVAKQIHRKPGCFSSEKTLFWVVLPHTPLNFQ